jgi:hypothetical protein
LYIQGPHSYKFDGLELALTNLEIYDQLPSAKQFYEEKKRQPDESPRVEGENEQLEQLQKELEEEEYYLSTHRKRRKRPDTLKDWLYQIGLATGTIKHGDGCNCCTSKEIVEQNEEMRRQKWKQICKERKLTKKEQEHKDRWDNELEQFEKWRMKWGFY